MEIITIVATIRNTTEERIVNDYTYRQLMHVGMTYLKDKMYVLSIIGDAMRSGKGKTQQLRGELPSSTGRLPSWFKPRTDRPYEVIDLDKTPIKKLRLDIGKYFG